MVDWEEPGITFKINGKPVIGVRKHENGKFDLKTEDLTIYGCYPEEPVVEEPQPLVLKVSFKYDFFKGEDNR